MLVLATCGLLDVVGNYKLLISYLLYDSADQKPCRIRDRELTYPGLHFTSHLQPGDIAARLDNLLRVAGSFKLGYVTA